MPHLRRNVPLNFAIPSLAEVSPSIEQRTWQLLHALEERQKNGVVDVGLALGHWAFDVMVSLSFSFRVVGAHGQI